MNGINPTVSPLRVALTSAIDYGFYENSALDMAIVLDAVPAHDDYSVTLGHRDVGPVRSLSNAPIPCRVTVSAYIAPDLMQICSVRLGCAYHTKSGRRFTALCDIDAHPVDPDGPTLVKRDHAFYDALGKRFTAWMHLSAFQLPTSVRTATDVRSSVKLTNELSRYYQQCGYVWDSGFLVHLGSLQPPGVTLFHSLSATMLPDGYPMMSSFYQPVGGVFVSLQALQMPADLSGGAHCTTPLCVGDIRHPGTIEAYHHSFLRFFGDVNSNMTFARK